MSSLTISGMSMASNIYSGTPVAAATYSNCLFRASCNSDSTIVADSDVFTITIASGGGGGGGGLLLPAGVFSGGFVGG